MFYKNIFKYKEKVPEYEFEHGGVYYSYQTYDVEREVIDLVIGKTFMIEIKGSVINVIGDVPVPLKVIDMFIKTYYQHQEITDAFKVWLKKTYPNAEIIYRLLISNIGGILYD